MNQNKEIVLGFIDTEETLSQVEGFQSFVGGSPVN